MQLIARTHCETLAPRLRRCDQEEVRACSGFAPALALYASLGADTLVADLDGTPEVIFGCDRYDATTGRPWLLASDIAFSPAWVVTFHRTGRRLVADWQRQFPLLHNFTDARNTRHHRWLKRLGFTFIARHERFGALGLPFYEFTRSNSPCVIPQRH